MCISVCLIRACKLICSNVGYELVNYAQIQKVLSDFFLGGGGGGGRIQILLKAVMGPIRAQHRMLVWYLQGKWTTIAKNP